MSLILVLALLVFGASGCEQTDTDTSVNEVSDVEKLSVEPKAKESSETDISETG